MSEDPVSQVARWRPRPEHVECRRASGEVETYQVTAGRRAWQRLRAMLPADVIELVGRKGPAIVGRWQAATTPIPTQDVELDDDDEGYDEDAPPTRDAAMLRWMIREFRGVYSDQLKATREIITVMSDALRVQRETFAHQPRAAAEIVDDDGYSKLADILGKAAGIMSMQQMARAAAPSTIVPPRDSVITE